MNGKILVAHDLEDVQPARTLRSVYLDPLQTRVSQNGGSVSRGDPYYFTLLIDSKCDAAPSFLALHEELEDHEGMLTRFGPRGVRDGAVTAM